MAVKHIEAFQRYFTVHKCTLYHDDIRTLFGLPRRKGSITAVENQYGNISITFEIKSNKFTKYKLTGGK
jgi:hypothetical protein